MATLPKDTDIKSIRDSLDNYNMIFSLINNISLKSQLRSGELLLRATKEYCDCDTSLGFLSKAKSYQKLLNSKKVKSLKKKKWTEDQIDNWIKDKLKKKTPHGKKSITEKERQLDIERWENLIKEILTKVKRIGLLKHWFSSSLNNEEISIKRKDHISLEELNRDLLYNIEEDVLYEFFHQYKY